MIAAIDALDRAVLDFCVAHRTPWLDGVIHGVGVAGTSVGVLAVVAAVGFVVVARARAWRTGAAVVLAVVAADLLVGVLKQIVARPRPPVSLQLLEGVGYAFPSTHAAFTSAGCAALVVAGAWRSGRRRRVAAAVLAAGCVVVGAMMVYLGAHWACDVLAGWAIGLVVGAVAGRLLRRRPA